jgi:hypothetical protein
MNQPQDCEYQRDSAGNKKHDSADRPRLGYAYQQEHNHPWHNTSIVHTDTRRAAATN